MADLTAHTALPSDPPWLKLALAERGVVEAPGSANNPKVVAYYKDAGHPGVKHDSVAWCAAFVGAMLKRAGITPTGSLLARSYLQFGKATSKPKRGDIVVFPRGEPWQGHVAFVLYVKGGRVWVIGGNQSNAVTITSYPESTVLKNGFRTVQGVAQVSEANKAADNFKQKAPPFMVLFMQDLDATPDDAFAVFGNFGYETNGFTKLFMSGVGGWPHWTGARLQAFKDYCVKNGLDPESDAANYAFVIHELKGTEKAALTKLKAAEGLEAKTIAFEQAYERAGVDNYPERIGWAKRAKQAWIEAGSPMPAKKPSTTLPDLINDTVSVGAPATVAVLTGLPLIFVTGLAVVCFAGLLAWRYWDDISVAIERAKMRQAAQEAQAEAEKVATQGEALDIESVIAPLLTVLDKRYDPTGSITTMTKDEHLRLKAALKS